MSARIEKVKGVSSVTTGSGESFGVTYPLECYQCCDFKHSEFLMTVSEPRPTIYS